MSEPNDKRGFLEELRRPYHYFDTPEGTDILKKLFVSLKPGILTGVAVSTVSVLTSKEKRSYGQIVRRVLHICQPIVGGVAAFVLVSNITAKLRRKSDKVSWFLGGVSTGIVFGSWWGTGVATISAAAVFGGLGMLRKDCLDKGYDLMPERKLTGFGSHWTWQYDWTMADHIPGNYKTSKQE